MNDQERLSGYTGPRPLIFDIAHGSSEDGPGLRTVVFMKGCPLKCLWCHNPEAQSPDEDLFFYEENCIRCGKCTEGCYSLARRPVGKYYAPEVLRNEILRDSAYYKASGGGVTFSGGEPLLFMDYLSEVLQMLLPNGISVIIETAGYYDPALFEKKILPYIDTVYFDIKVMDPELHRLHTGRSNELILSNFKRLRSLGVKVLPRVPLVPFYTATEDNLSRIASFLKDLNLHECAFLPYNPSGLLKWQKLVRENKVIPQLPEEPLSFEDEQRWIDFFRLWVK